MNGVSERELRFDVFGIELNGPFQAVPTGFEIRRPNPVLSRLLQRLCPVCGGEQPPFGHCRNQLVHCRPVGVARPRCGLRLLDCTIEGLIVFLFQSALRSCNPQFLRDIGQQTGNSRFHLVDEGDFSDCHPGGIEADVHGTIVLHPVNQLNGHVQILRIVECRNSDATVA